MQVRHGASCWQKNWPVEGQCQNCTSRIQNVRVGQHDQISSSQKFLNVGAIDEIQKKLNAGISTCELLELPPDRIANRSACDHQARAHKPRRIETSDELRKAFVCSNLAEEHGDEFIRLHPQRATCLLPAHRIRVGTAIMAAG